MAGVRLEFAQFGHFDYFNIFRNSVSTAIENLEQPIGTSSTMYYEDLTTEPNNDYYYRIGVVRDSIEEFSEEIHVRTEVMFDPPYNLIVEFKNDETNRLELNWSLDGFIDEQRYYCSETPIDLLNLPPPKAILDSDVLAYIDTDIDADKTYYVCVSSLRNGIEKVSDVLQATAKIYHVWLEFNASGIVKKGTSAVQFNNSGCTFVQMPDGTYAARFSSPNTYLYSDAGSTVSGDVEIEMVYTFLSIAGFYSTWYDSRDVSFRNGQTIGIYDGGTFIEFRNDAGAGASGGLSTPAHALNTKMKLTWKRIGNVWKYYVDDVFIANLGNVDPYLSNIMQNQVFIGRVKNSDSEYYLNGYIHRWSIRKL